MNSIPRSRRKKRGPGCWITILVVLVVIIAAAILLYQPIRRSKQLEQSLNDRFGDAAQFLPAANGSISPRRMEAFLRVREKVFVHCADFQELFDDLVRTGIMDQNDNTSKNVPTRESLSGIKKLFGFGPALLRFVDTRNQALWEEEMGIGEYEYIYCLAYLENLRRVDESRFGGIDEAYVGERAREELVEILGNQLDALMAGDIESADSGLAASRVDDDLASSLREQIAALRSGDQLLPWEDGLPPALAASITPYADRLSQYYCDGIAKLELMQKNKGFDVRN
jgi:hypothetical protein